MSQLRDVSEMSEDARLVYFAGVALCWEHQGEGVPGSLVRYATGLDDERVGAAMTELYEDACAWPYASDVFMFDGARDLCMRSMGPPGRPSALEWTKLRARVFAEHGESCMYCRDERGELAVDHVVPLAKGGSNHFFNLLPACKSCNSAKGGKSWIEWCLIWRPWKK